METFLICFLIISREKVIYINTIQDRVHAPQVKSEFGKKCIKYRGSIIWNHILSLRILFDISEALFVNCLKRCIRQNQLLIFSTQMHLSCNDYYLSPMICCVMFLCIMVVTMNTFPCFAPRHPLLISVVSNRYGAHKSMRISRPLCLPLPAENGKNV